MALGLTTRRFDIAYCVALFFAINSCGTLVFGLVPEGPLGWTAFAGFMIAPIVLWWTRNSRAGPHLQSAFIILAAGFVIAVALPS